MTDAIAFDDVAIHADGGCRIASAQQWQLQQQRRLGATDDTRRNGIICAAPRTAAAAADATGARGEATCFPTH